MIAYLIKPKMHLKITAKIKRNIDKMNKSNLFILKQETEEIQGKEENE